jgi:hypothetical protein
LPGQEPMAFQMLPAVPFASEGFTSTQGASSRRDTRHAIFPEFLTRTFKASLAHLFAGRRFAPAITAQSSSFPTSSHALARHTATLFWTDTVHKRHFAPQGARLME